MKRKNTILLAMAASACLALPSIAFSHGGTYRGPGDTVPPGAGGRGGRTGGGGGGPITNGPTGPSDPGPGRPSRGTPTGGPGPLGGGGRGGSTGGIGFTGADDLTRWVYWWEFNKDRFLRIKDRIWSGTATTATEDIELGRGAAAMATETLRPSPSDVQQRILPALREALHDSSSSRDILSSALIAIARTARDDEALRDLRKFLAHDDQEVKETAVIALGITKRESTLDELLEIVADTPRARRLCKRTELRFRERSFAAYAAGLIANGSTKLELKQRVFDSMRAILQSKKPSRRDVKAGAIQAIRILRIPDGQKGQLLRDEAQRFLIATSQNKSLYEGIRAHALDALARIGSSVGERNAKGRAAILARAHEVLRKKDARRNLQRAACLLLGQLASQDDVRSHALLEASWKNARDVQVKRFAMIALGMIGSSEAKSFLRKRLLKAKTEAKPWVALSLALAVHESKASTEAQTIAHEVRKTYQATSNPDTRSGLAIALGIMQDRDADDMLLAGFQRHRKNDEAAGYHALALGMIGSQMAKEDIRVALRNAERRELLLSQGATALGLLGDKRVAMDLVERLSDDNTVAVSASLSQAIGFIGDRRTIDPVISLLRDRKAKQIPRAFAAVALGRIGDGARLPWNSAIARNLNYRANFETLTGSGTGIPDLL